MKKAFIIIGAIISGTGFIYNLYLNWIGKVSPYPGILIDTGIICMLFCIVLKKNSDKRSKIRGMKINRLRKITEVVSNFLTKEQYTTPIPKIFKYFFEDGKAYEPGQARLLDEWLKIPALREYITTDEDGEYILGFRIESHNLESYNKTKEKIFGNSHRRKVVLAPSY